MSLMVPGNERERAIAAWLQERAATAPQLVFSVGMAVFGSLAALGTQQFLGPTLAPCVAGTLAVAWASVLGANSAYWLWYVPMLIRQVCRTPGLRLRWHDPVRTEGVRGLSRLLGRSTLLAASGAVLFEVPLLYSYWRERESEFITAITILSTIAVLVTIVVVGLMPQYWLTTAVRAAKDAILDSLSRQIETARAEGAGEQDSAIVQEVTLYDFIANAPDATVDGRAIRDYALATALAVLPVVLPLLFERSS
jgi:hypothetical protein